MEPTVNEIYRVKHASGMIRWRFTRKEISRPYRQGERSHVRYYGMNLATGREVMLRSTRKIKGELEPPHGTKAGRGNYA